MGEWKLQFYRLLLILCMSLFRAIYHWRACCFLIVAFKQPVACPLYLMAYNAGCSLTRSSHGYTCVLPSAKLSCSTPLLTTGGGGEHCCFSQWGWVMALPWALARYGVGLPSVRIVPYHPQKHCGDLKLISCCWHVALCCPKARFTFRGEGTTVPLGAQVSLRTVSGLAWFWFGLVWFVWLGLFGWLVFYVWSMERACAGWLWWQEKSVSLCDANSRDTFYPHTRFSVLVPCLNPWTGLLRRCITSVSTIQGFLQSPYSSNSPMAFLWTLCPSEVVLKQCNDSRKDQSTGGQAWGSTGLKEGSGLCRDWDCVIWKHEGRIVHVMGSGNRKMRVDFERG